MHQRGKVGDIVPTEPKRAQFGQAGKRTEVLDDGVRGFVRASSQFRGQHQHAKPCCLADAREVRYARTTGFEPRQARDRTPCDRASLGQAECIARQVAQGRVRQMDRRGSHPPREVAGPRRRCIDRAPVERRVVAPRPAAVAQDDVVAAVSVQIAHSGQAPVPVAGEEPGRALQHNVAHKTLVAPPPAQVSKENVAATVGVEVTDRNQTPSGSAERRLGHTLREDLAAVHGEEAPAAVDVAEQNVVAAIGVEVPYARHSPVWAPRQTRPAALGPDHVPPPHRVIQPTPVVAPHQQVVGGHRR